jgi:CheY-like chemotaxis protein
MYNIAIVDDNEAWCFTLEFFLRQHGFSVSSFNTPDIFLKQAHQFNLALIDFSIPVRRFQQEVDGPSLIARIKRQLPQPPLLVLISAYFTKEVLTYPQDICPEADAYLSKSCELDEILRCVQHLLSSNRSGELQFSSTSQNKQSYRRQRAWQH